MTSEEGKMLTGLLGLLQHYKGNGTEGAEFLEEFETNLNKVIEGA
ncbi:MAG: hypothetical protein PHG79_13260 [Methanosarcina sp.]|nr:hypothetical protein [Methanosarcina sp.]